MKVSILLPTAGRPHLLKEMVDSLIRTTQMHDIEICAVVDGCGECADYLMPLASMVDFSYKRRGALWAWNHALHLSSGDIIIPAGDDHLFHDNWLDYALESHRERLGGYGMVGLNDLAYDGNKQVATMWLFDRKYCKEQMGGIFAPPVYRYYCIDLEWWEKAKMLGMYYWDERAIEEHRHSAHGKRPVDEIDDSKSDWITEDNETFRQRKEQGFPIVWEPLI